MSSDDEYALDEERERMQAYWASTAGIAEQRREYLAMMGSDAVSCSHFGPVTVVAAPIPLLLPLL